MNIVAAVFLSSLLSSASAQADRDIIKVNGTMIRQSEIMQRLWERYGAETLDEMVDELLLRQAVASSKTTVSDEAVEKRIKKMRAQFTDPKLLEAQLSESGSSLEKLKKDIADGLSRQQYIAKERHLRVEDDELKKAFAEHGDDLGIPEGVHLRHILVKTEDEAQDILKQVRAGKDFKALAAAKSLAPTGKMNGGDYGYITKGMLPAEIEAIAFAMKQGELRIVPSDKGFHILQALERRRAAPAKFEAVKDDLREILLQQKVKAALPEIVSELRKKAEIQPQGR